MRRLVAGTLVALASGGLLAGLTVAPPAFARAPDRAMGWRHAERVWAAPGAATISPGVSQVVDSRGVVTAMWTVRSGEVSRVMAARRGARGWSTPRTVLTGPAGASGLTTSIVVGPKDVVVVAAAGASEAGASVEAAAFASGAWAAPVVLAEYSDPSRYGPSSLYGMSAIADATGVSVLWQVHESGSPYAVLSARSLPVSVGTWSAAVVLDDHATGSFAVVRDGARTVRAAWQDGPDVVTAQGSALGWGARETIGASGTIPVTPNGVDPYPWPTTQAAAGLDGSVLVTWTPPDPAVGCSTTWAAQRSTVGWSPATAVPPLGAGTHCVMSVVPFVGGGLAPTVVGLHSERWLGWQSTATTWTGTAWGPAYETGGLPYAAGGTLLAIHTVHNYSVLGPGADISWLTSSTLGLAGWSAPIRVSDPSGGWVESPIGAASANGSFVLMYSKRRPWRSVAIWSAAFSDGRWTSARVVAAPVVSRKGSDGASIAAPVTAPRGRVTAVWVIDDRVRASTTR